METKQNKKHLNGTLVAKAASRISIQGFEGSFHQVAARNYFGNDVEVICCPTFPEVLKIASDNSLSNGGVMAIENSIAGSILGNYNLLRKSGLQIVGEIYLEIHQNLLVNPGVTLEDIREVHSHPMAIQQCLKFLDKYNWKLVESEDTALSAKHVHQHKSKHIAAIASTLAAELYGLDIIAPDIHTVRHNYTRFLILQTEAEAPAVTNANKATVTFFTDNSRGSLARVLTKIADGGIDLSKLQSFPIPETDWHYMFGVDMEFTTLEQFHSVIEAIRPLTGDVTIYGIYKKGTTVRF
ncbi:MAG: prephenate dehydratase [Panacibacter sp.]